jgi:hypothetical protein
MITIHNSFKILWINYATNQWMHWKQLQWELQNSDEIKTTEKCEMTSDN